MDGSLFKELSDELMIRCGVVLNRNNKIKLKGIFINKAVKILYDHPAISFERNIDINIYPKYWIRNDTDFESVSGYFETLPFKAGLLNVKAESIEYNFVKQYFYESMSKNRFEIVKIERYQNQLKFDSYYQNLRNVQYKMGHSDLKSDYDGKDLEKYNPFHEKEEGENENENEKDKGEEEGEGEGEEEEKEEEKEEEEKEKEKKGVGEKWLFYVFRYQSDKDILGISGKGECDMKDYGFLPLKISAEEPEIKTIDDLNTEKPIPEDVCNNLGDNALYFNINRSQKILYSHSKDSKGEDKKYKQLLCRVVTGIEKNYSNDVIKSFETNEKGKTHNDMKEMQKPDFIVDKNIEEKAKNDELKDYEYKINWYDSHMYDCSESKKKEFIANSHRTILPINKSIKIAKTDSIKKKSKKNMQSKSNDDSMCSEHICDLCGETACLCLYNTKLYSVYSPNRCYPAYVITYKMINEYTQQDESIEEDSQSSEEEKKESSNGDSEDDYSCKIQDSKELIEEQNEENCEIE